MEQGRLGKRAKKARQKTVSMFLNFAFATDVDGILEMAGATAGIIVGAILGLLIVAAISALLKAVWLVIQKVIKR